MSPPIPAAGVQAEKTAPALSRRPDAAAAPKKAATGSLNGAAIAQTTRAGTPALRRRHSISLPVQNGAASAASKNITVGRRPVHVATISLPILTGIVDELPQRIAHKSTSFLNPQDAMGVEKLLLQEHPELKGKLPVDRFHRTKMREHIKKTWDHSLLQRQDAIRQKHQNAAKRKQSALAEKQQTPATPAAVADKTPATPAVVADKTPATPNQPAPAAAPAPAPAPPRRTLAQEIMQSKKTGTAANKIANLPNSDALHGAIRNTVRDRNLNTGLADQLHQVADYNGRLDGALTRIGALAEKLRQGTLSPGETTELDHLIRFNRQAVAAAQTWIGEQSDEIIVIEDGTPAAPLLRGLAQRLAEQHMQLANLTAICSNSLPDEAIVSRADRLYNGMIQAQGIVHGLNTLLADNNLPRNTRAVLTRTLAEVRIQADALQALHARAATAPASPNDYLAALIDIPIGTDKGTADAARQTLTNHWNAVGNGASDKALLPHAINGLSQTDMLDHFVRSQLSRAGINPAGVGDLNFLWSRGRTDALNNGPWQPVNTQLPLSITTDDEQEHTGQFASTITPAGSLLAPHLGRPYPANGVASHDRLQVDHVPNLAHTQLTDDAGNVIFQAWRHGILDPYAISPKTMRAIPRDELASILEKTVGVATLQSRWGGTPQQVAERMQTSMSDSNLRVMTAAVRRGGAGRMAEDFAVSWIATHPAARAAALRGETVTIPPINSVSLVTPDLVLGDARSENAMLRNQTAAFRRMQNGGKPVTVLLRGPNDTVVPAKVQFGKIRTFNFGVNAAAVDRPHGLPMSAPIPRTIAGWGFAAKLNNPELTDFLGPASQRWAGGAVEAHLDKQVGQLAALDEMERHIDDLARLRENIPPQTPERTAALKKLDDREAQLLKAFTPRYQQDLINELDEASARQKQLSGALERQTRGSDIRKRAEGVALGEGVLRSPGAPPGAENPPGTFNPDGSLLEEKDEDLIIERAVDIFIQADDWVVAHNSDQLAAEMTAMQQPPADETAEQKSVRLTRLEGLKWASETIVPARAQLDLATVRVQSLERQISSAAEAERSRIAGRNPGFAAELQDIEDRRDALVSQGQERQHIRRIAFNRQISASMDAYAATYGVTGMDSLADIGRERNRLEKHISLVTETTRQVKTIWRNESFRIGDNEPYKMVSRLAFLSNLIGEETLFNCKSGKDRTGQLDAEVKLKAATAHLIGVLPEPDAPPTEESQRNATTFALKSGNLEMQGQATGLPGYKLRGVTGLQTAMRPDATPAYRGGSDYVAA